MKRVMSVSIHVSEHDDGHKFYEYEFRNCSELDAIGILRHVLDKLKNGGVITVLRKEIKGYTDDH